MIETFLFYLVCNFRNRVVSFVRRLRRPKYLISALVGFGYLYLVFLRQFFSPRPSMSRQIPLNLDMLPLVETGCAVLLLGFVLLPWIWPGRGNDGLRFTEAEIQFLFPAPISRRALIHFRLVKMQVGLLFGVLISFLVFGRGRFFGHPVYFLVTLWCVYFFVGLYYMGTTLTQTSLLEHGTSGLRWKLWTVGLVAAVFVSIVVWVKWFIPALPGPGSARPDDLSAWLLRAAESGPAYYFLAPFKVLVHPAFARGPVDFLLRLAPALAILLVVYLWVMHSDVAFEEASLEKARRVAIRLEAARSGIAGSSQPSASKVRRPIFELAPTGFAHTAIFWKNLVSAGRLDMRRVLPAIVALGIAMAVMISTRGRHGEALPTIIGSLAAVMAVFLTLIGPMLVRDDLRSDLLQVDLLKTYPIPGSTVALGEVLAPAAMLAAIEWVLLLIAAFVLPAVGKVSPSVSQRIAVGLSAALLLPCFSMIGVLIQNAAVLIMPGWVQLGKAHRQGIEATGQRLITMVATLLLLVFAVIPAALLFAAVFFSGYGLLGLAIVPIASLIAALGLLGEAAVAIFWLGRLYDKLDISLEGVGR